MKNFKIPNIEEVNKIAQSYLEGNYTIDRLMTGLCHYVFDVKGEKSRFVIRICHPDNQEKLRGNIFWTNEFESENLPLPKILKSSIGVEEFSYLILEHLDGVDLGKVVDNLNTQELSKVVDSLVLYDKIAEGLPLSSGYGWGLSYKCSQLSRSWIAIIDSAITRAGQWITEVGKTDLSVLLKVEITKKKFETYLRSIEPKAYFHDLTTKNLLISPNTHSIVGFVDIDEMGFGDRLFHLSLMKMALFSNGHSEKLVELWLEKINASSEEREVVYFYTLIHCVAFMGENGKAFNKQEALFDEEYHDRLSIYYDNLIKKIN